MPAVFKSLTRLQHIAIIISTFAIPVSFRLIQGLQATGFCLSCVNMGELTLYVVWYVIAVIVIAFATRDDRTRVYARIDRVSSELVNNLNQVKEEHQRGIQEIQERTDDIRLWVQNIDRAIREEFGVDVPIPASRIRYHYSLTGC